MFAKIKLRHAHGQIAWQLPHPIQEVVLRAAIDRSIRDSYSLLMALLRGLFWFGLFIVFTFCFVVLFEYGPRDFAKGVRKEYARVKSFVVKQTEEITKTKKNR